MVGLVSFGNKKTYDDFKQQFTPAIASLFDEIRDFCFSLGDNVIEDVRMHRVVMCKSMTFRWFLDIEPQKDSIILKIQTSRKDPKKEISIKSENDFKKVESFIRDAFKKIH